MPLQRKSTRVGLSRTQTKVHDNNEIWDWNGCPTENCHAPTFMTTENGYCIDCNTKHRRTHSELPRGQNTVLRGLETWSKNGLECNPLKTWEEMRESADLNATISKMSLHDLVGALTQPIALKQIGVTREQVEGLPDVVPLNGYEEFIPAFAHGLYSASRKYRKHDMECLRLFKSLQQVMDEVLSLDDDSIAQVYCQQLLWLLTLTIYRL